VEVVGDGVKIFSVYNSREVAVDIPSARLHHCFTDHGSSKAAIPARPGNINTLQGTHQNALGLVRQLWKFFVFGWHGKAKMGMITKLSNQPQAGHKG
jgi:hypothetical protein